MNSETQLLAGGMVMLGLATSALVVLPYLQLKDVKPAVGLKPYSAAELRGRAEYIRQGCVYCHTQQPRDRAQTRADFERGWGRATVATDYAYDQPHLLGSMRTGPDLMNIGVRQPSADWHLGHLYQPRAYVPGSIMPAYPFLFETKPEAEPGETVLQLPPPYGLGPGQVLVARPAALDLVRYLQSLKRDYPVLPASTRAAP